MSQQIEVRTTGTVRWYDARKGFGFAAPQDGGKDVFIHQSALKGTRRLKEGERIEFAIEHGEKGPTAVDVLPLDNGGSRRETPARRDRTEHREPAVVREAPAAYAEAPMIGDGEGFAALGLIEPLVRAVTSEGYTVPTPIQVQSIPYVLDGRDLLGCAQTGTGKTAAFALPILQRMTLTQPRTNGTKKPIRTLVLTPTRELATQIGDSFAAYGRFAGFKHTVLYGGVGQNPQVEALRRGIDILVATPGRLLDLIGQGYVKLDTVEIVVLDEADRMLDMGFIHDVKRVMALLPKQKQVLLFSATMPTEIVSLANSFLHNPAKVAVTPEKPTVDAIDQWVYHVRGKNDKQLLLEHLLKDRSIKRVLVFTRTKHGANKVVKLLARVGITAEPIHGNKSQAARERALANFKSGRTRVLIATDVAARGIDIDDITHVIQFDLPNVPETYVHRIGRTGRAGATGIAFAFCDPEERPLLRDIEKMIRKPVPVVREHPFA
jgi:ATP-dependent RNA helicase RhlE